MPIGTAQPSVVAGFSTPDYGPSRTASPVSCISEVSSWPAIGGNAARTSITFVADPVDGSRMYPHRRSGAPDA